VRKQQRVPRELAEPPVGGAQVLANACGPCIGQWRRAGAPPSSDAPSTIVTSFNRNFPGRNDGRAATQAFIASPEIVIALFAGRLSFDPRRDALLGADGAPFRLEPPAPAAPLPRDGFAPGRDLYVPPPEQGSDLPLAIAPGSERLAPLAPWPAWDGRDFEGLPLLIKTRGKTTTDQISPAGPWLRYRDALLPGAVRQARGAVQRQGHRSSGSTGRSPRAGLGSRSSAEPSAAAK
jgi:aconitate hydratase